jgi:tRNA(Ile)-lysidine synthetase-like protein
MLPLRHSNSIKNNELILKVINNLRIENDFPIYKRFYRATLLRLTKLNSIISMENQSIKNKKDISNKDIIDILDENSIQIINYIKIDLESNLDNKLIQSVIKFIEKFKIKDITISLSGGVDSMVLATIVSSIKNKYKLNIKAFNINYGNRQSSKYETELCIRWCELLKIPIYVRHIEEIKRSRDKDREIYEEITKIIRFHCYQLLGNTVFLGHNKDDKIENILSNIIKQKNFDNLYGMVDYYQDVVPIGRPLLEISKKDIYDFAKEFSIPYVYDSTPKWCERGQKRDILIPFLDNFDPRFLIGLDKLSKYVGDLTEISNDFIEQCIHFNIDILDKLSKNVKIAKIDSKIIDYDKQFWNLLLIKICKKFKLRYISQKSCNNSYSLIKLNNRNKIILSNNLYINDKYEIYYNS